MLFMRLYRFLNFIVCRRSEFDRRLLNILFFINSWTWFIFFICSTNCTFLLLSVVESRSVFFLLKFDCNLMISVNCVFARDVIVNNCFNSMFTFVSRIQLLKSNIFSFSSTARMNCIDVFSLDCRFCWFFWMSEINEIDDEFLLFRTVSELNERFFIISSIESNFSMSVIELNVWFDWD